MYCHKFEFIVYYKLMVNVLILIVLTFANIFKMEETKMKRILSLLLSAVMICSLLAVGTVAHAEETEKYVKDIYFQRETTLEKAYKALEKTLVATGNEYVAHNFNINSGNTKADAICMGYTYTTDPNEAITDILLESFGSWTNLQSTLTLGEIKYTSDKQDLNDDANGDYIRLFTTRSHLVGKLVADIGFLLPDTAEYIGGDETFDVMASYSKPNTPLNLNQGTKSTVKINMIYKRVDDPTVDETQKTYVHELFSVAAGTKEEAVAQLTALLAETGLPSTYSEVDLNQGTKGDYVLLGWTLTTDITKALTGVMIGKSSDAKDITDFVYHNGVRYDKTGVDLNKSAKGEYIYTYVTYDNGTGKVIEDIGFEVGGNLTFETTKLWSSVNSFDSPNSKADLNDGAFGKYIYMWKKTSNYAPEKGSKFISDIIIKSGEDKAAVLVELELSLIDCSDEYDIFPFDLNEGTDGKFVFMGWAYTYDENEAITDIMLHHSPRNDRLPDTFEKYGVTYTRIGVDLSDGNSDNYIYLYVTYDKTLDQKVYDIGFEMGGYFSSNEDYFVKSGSWDTVSTYAGEKKYDLNDDAGGMYIYMWYDILPYENVVNTDTEADTESDTDSGYDTERDTETDSEGDTDTERPGPGILITYGDADSSGEVTMEDVTKLQRFIAKLDTLTIAQRRKSDVTGDGNINLEDVTTIQKFIAKLIYLFPVENKL